MNPTIRKRILTQLYRERRAQWSGRPPRSDTTKAESMAAAKFLLNSENMPNPDDLASAKIAARTPEVWILYTRISNKMLAKLILQGFAEQEEDTKDSAQQFWETLG